MKPDCRKPKTARLIKNEEGSTGVLFAMLAIPMFAMVGMAVDYARMMNSRESMQQSLDAAVLAGRNAATPQEAVSLAQAYFKANLKKVIANATATFTVNSDGDLEGSASANVVTPVLSLAKSVATQNASNSAVSTFALARPDKSEPADGGSSGSSGSSTGGLTPCMHVMDQNGTSFELDSNSGFSAVDCEVRVRSNNAVAMKEKSSSNVKFKKVLVKGGAQVESEYATSKFWIVDGNHTVTQQADVVGNPYDTAMASVARSITTGACTTSNTNKTWTGNVNPGTYCGDTVFNNATFATGLYIIKTGNGNGKDGRLTIQGNSDGSAGVTFFLADNKSQFKKYQVSEGKTFKAPTSGPTQGILFFESSNRGQTYCFSIQSVNKQSWTGMVYFPSMDLTMDSLSEWPKMNIAMAVNQLKMRSISAALVPYSWTPFGYTQPIQLQGEVQTSRKDGWLME